ncbi:MAG: type VI secretion system baseplate subunit TssG [Pseudomonadota bacterium]
MEGPQREPSDALSLLAPLADDPRTFNFFQAMRLIEAAYSDRPRFGRSARPRQDPLRLRQKVDMAFAPSTVAEFAVQDPKGGPGFMSAYFFGVFGPNGPLPLHVTEYARGREYNERDRTFAAFADMFHHRLISLFYRAYASADPAASFDRPDDDPFADRIAALAGIMGSEHRDRDAMPDLSKLRFAGRLSNGSKNEEGLLAMISAFFGVPVEIESFVGSWLELEPGDQWQLGKPGIGLGTGTSLGGRVWSRQAKFRIKIGPLPMADYRRLLPGGVSLYRLAAIVRNYLGEMLDWDVNLVLAPGEAPKAELGKTGELGWTTWVGNPPADQPLDDLYVSISRH